MARYIDADKLKEALSHYGIEDVIFRDEIEMYIDDTPTADVAPKSEGEKPMFENTRNILHHLKRQIHDKAVYPHNAGIDAYITLKAFDAILQNYLNGLK